MKSLKEENHENSKGLRFYPKILENYNLSSFFMQIIFIHKLIFLKRIFLKKLNIIIFQIFEKLIPRFNISNKCFFLITLLSINTICIVFPV